MARSLLEPRREEQSRLKHDQRTDSLRAERSRQQCDHCALGVPHQMRSVDEQLSDQGCFESLKSPRASRRLVANPGRFGSHSAHCPARSRCLRQGA